MATEHTPSECALAAVCMCVFGALPSWVELICNCCCLRGSKTTMKEGMVIMLTVSVSKQINCCMSADARAACETLRAHSKS